MNKARYILGSINLINIILAAVLIIFANYIVLPLLNVSVKFSPSTVKKSAAENDEDKKPPADEKSPSPADYIIIAEQNLFHPERKIPVDKKDAQPLPKPDFVLYGTLITGDINIAYMEDKKAPQSTPGRGKRQIPLKQGDSMSGFSLKEIGPDSVVMTRGVEVMTVLLNDPSHPKTRTDTLSQIAASSSDQGVKTAPMVTSQPMKEQPASQEKVAAPQRSPFTPAPDSGGPGSLRKSFLQRPYK